MLKLRASIDIKPIQSYIESAFGIGGKAQEKWTMTVFEGSEYRVPQDTGRFLADSKAATRQVAADGVNVYTGVPYGGAFQASGGVPSRWQGFDYAMALWYGKQFIPFGGGEVRPINYSNPNATPRWTLTAAEAHGNEWTAEYQRWVDGGF